MPVVRALLLLVALVLVTPAASAYRDCFVQRTLCAEYNYSVGNTHFDGETAQGRFGAGQHKEGDFRGTNAYLFLPNAWFAVYEGQWLNRDRTLVTVGVGSTQYFYFEMGDRALRYPNSYHCIEIGPGPNYFRCGTGLP